MKFKTSERLQRLFDKCDQDTVEADLTVDFDDVDEFGVVEEFVKGMSQGIKLYQKLLKARKLDKAAQIYKLTYACYVDDDGVKFFVGSEDNLAALFESNPEEDAGA